MSLWQILAVSGVVIFLIAWNVLFERVLNLIDKAWRGFIKKGNAIMFVEQVRWLEALEGRRQRPLHEVARAAGAFGMKVAFSVTPDDSDMPDRVFISLRGKAEALAKCGWLTITGQEDDALGRQWLLSITELGKEILGMHKAGRSYDEIYQRQFGIRHAS